MLSSQTQFYADAQATIEELMSDNPTTATFLGDLHTGKMTVDEAICFIVERAGLEPNDTKAEVRRYTLSPTQPQCYLMGKLQILDIVDEHKHRFPQVSMRRMHDSILL